jgi:hypothetical protein
MKRVQFATLTVRPPRVASSDSYNQSINQPIKMLLMSGCDTATQSKLIVYALIQSENQLVQQFNNQCIWASATSVISPSNINEGLEALCPDSSHQSYSDDAPISRLGNRYLYRWNHAKTSLDIYKIVKQPHTSISNDGETQRSNSQSGRQLIVELKWKGNSSATLTKQRLQVLKGLSSSWANTQTRYVNCKAAFREKQLELDRALERLDTKVNQSVEQKQRVEQSMLLLICSKDRELKHELDELAQLKEQYRLLQQPSQPNKQSNRSEAMIDDDQTTDEEGWDDALMDDH